MEENCEKPIEHQIIKKKRCIPLNELNKYPNKNIDITEESLKKYVSYFDLDPKINFQVFQLIDSYKKYLNKYKYTLDYDDAKKLGCFEDVNENDLIKSINSEISNLNIKDKSITKIESLSKSKLIKFLLYLLNIELIKENFESTINEIKLYKLEYSLIFKVPIYFGNNELKYYFFYELFVEFFLYNYEGGNKSSKRKVIFNSKKTEYFPTIETENSEYTEIDLTEFEKRKKDLLDYVYFKKEKNIQKNIEKDKNESIELDEDKENEEKEKIKNKSYVTFAKKLEYFKFYKKVIINIFFQGYRDEEILEKIKFLYFYMIFEIKNNKDPNKKFLNSFYKKNDELDIKKFNKFEQKIKDLFKGDHNQLVITNIKLEHIFFENIENPFIENNYLYFSFPFLFHKSFLEYDEEIYKDFLDFLKYIYQSPLISDIFYLCSEFSEFEYPLKNEDILDEMLKNTFFIPCESKKLYGYTQKNLISIFIPINISDEKSNFLEKFIIKLGFILNTTVHEQLKHYVKALLFFNSFRFGENIHIESDEDLDNEENQYLEGLMMKKKMSKKNNLMGKDGGHRTEILLYGEVLERLTSLQGLKMFYYSTWDTSIKEHFLKFKNNYNQKGEAKSGNILPINYLNLNEIFNDKDVCPFLKKILRKFMNCKSIKEKDLLININFSSKKNPETLDEKQGDNGEILIDPDFKEIFPRTYYRDYNP